MPQTKTGEPILYIFSGQPGSGKTTLSQHLAQRTNAVYLRIDTIEQALRDIGVADVQGEGYLFAYRLASDNLRLGLSVVSDSCNPIELTRHAWEQTARDAGAGFVNIEVLCSDAGEHRRRVEQRVSTVPGLRLPTWSEVENREYHAWTGDGYLSRFVVYYGRRDRPLESASTIQANDDPRSAKQANGQTILSVRKGSCESV